MESPGSIESSSTDLAPLEPHGVPLHVCLRGFGRHLASSSATVDTSTTAQVRPVSSYDHFLSHDWGTPRWRKVLSLMIVFNAPVAFWTTLLVSISLSSWECSRHLSSFRKDIGWPSFRTCPSCYSFAFGSVSGPFFWAPRTSSWTSCAFLKIMTTSKSEASWDSETTWSVRRNLPCFGRRDTSLGFGAPTRLPCSSADPSACGRSSWPVTMPVILCLFSAAWLCVRLQLTVVEAATVRSGDSGLRILVKIGLMLLLNPVIFVMQSYLGMGLVQDLEKLPKQLQEFSISDSQCSCCFFKHRHPQTGKRIMCDRKVVYQAVSDSYDDQEVRRTFSHEVSRTTSGLDVFDGAVRSQLSDRIAEQRLSSSLIPLDLFIYMVWAWDIPWLAPRLHLISQVGNLARNPEYEHYDDLLRVFYALAEMIDWAKGLPSILVLLFVSMRLWKLMSRWTCCPRIVRALASAPMVILSTALVFVIISLALDLTEDDWNPLNTLPFTFFLLLAICLLKPPKAKLPSFSSGKPGSSPKPSPSEARSWSDKLDQSAEELSSTSKDVHVADEVFPI